MNKNNKSIILHFSAGLVVLVLVFWHFFSDTSDSHSSFFPRLGSGILIFYVNYYILTARLLLKRKTLFFILGVVALLVANVEFYYWLKHLGYIVDIFDDPGFTEAMDRVMIYFSYSIVIILGTTIRIYNEWNENEIDKRTIESQKNAAELEALKKQINPHFLFNSLNTICSLAIKKSDKTVDATIMLSDLLRYVIYEANDNWVLLEKEITFIENYVNLQLLRLANKDHVELDVVGHISAQKIPPLLLLSFIENAFKYGVDEKGDTRVSIMLGVQQDNLVFTCRNCIGKREKSENSGIGIQNAKDRLNLLYPNNHVLKIEEENNTFTSRLTFIVSLTLKFEAE